MRWVYCATRIQSPSSMYNYKDVGNVVETCCWFFQPKTLSSYPVSVEWNHFGERFNNFRDFLVFLLVHGYVSLRGTVRIVRQNFREKANPWRGTVWMVRFASVNADCGDSVLVSSIQVYKERKSWVSGQLHCNITCRALWKTACISCPRARAPPRPLNLNNYGLRGQEGCLHFFAVSVPSRF